MKNDGKNKYLLIIPCSKIKKDLFNVSALELYDGPFYRIIRKDLQKNIDILILSAKYGLIDSTELISPYDQKMIKTRAEELSHEVMEKLESAFRHNHYDEIFITLGKIYMIALEESENILDKHNVYWGSGQIGERLHELKTWLQIITNENASGA